LLDNLLLEYLNGISVIVQSRDAYRTNVIFTIFSRVRTTILRVAFSESKLTSRKICALSRERTLQCH